MNPMKMKISVNDSFSSFEDFEKTLNSYKKCELQEFWIRDARTLENQRKRCPETVCKANAALKYYYIRLACVKGGRKFKTKNENSSRTCTTLRQECPATMFLKISPCQQTLVVVEVNDGHNHTTSIATFESLSQQRLKLPEATKQAAKHALNAGANKKILLDNIRAETGSRITLKDLTNMVRKTEKKSFEECINVLKNIYRCDTVEVLVDNENMFKGLYFQDERMKTYFAAFPEMLFIDGTYCLVDLRAATYLIMVEDGNGQSEIVAVGLLVDEDEKSLNFFIEAFKKSNPTWENVKVIMADKDKTERKVFKKHFPNAKLMICLFHAFQIFNREVSTKKMNITKEEMIKSKEYLQKLAYASSHEEYEKIFHEMTENVPKPVLKYYKDNWADISEQWVRCYTFQNLCLLNSTNNRLESLNAKLKSVITRYSPLEDFIKHLFVYINSYRCSKDVTVSQMLNKRLAKPLETGSAKALYCDLLTTFAYTQIEKQLELAKSYKNRNLTQISDELMLMSTSEGLLSVTPSTCECMFRKSNELPCRHIFQCRELMSLPLFDPTLCLERWTRQYCADILENETHKETLSTPIITHNNDTGISCQIKKNYLKASLTSHKKFNIMDGYGKRMAQLSSEVSTRAFHARATFIQTVIKMWEEGKDSVLNENFSKIFESDTAKHQESCVHGNQELPTKSTDAAAIIKSEESIVKQIIDEKNNEKQRNGVADSGIIESYAANSHDSSDYEVQSESQKKSKNEKAESAADEAAIPGTPSADLREKHDFIVLSQDCRVADSGIIESDAANSHDSCDYEVQSESQKKSKNEKTDSAADEAVIPDTPNADSREKHDFVFLSQDCINRNSVNLHDIKMPLKVLKRGRPKGFGNTVIGLKKQKLLKRQKPVEPHVLQIGGSARTPIKLMPTAEEAKCLEEYLEEEYLDDSMLA